MGEAKARGTNEDRVMAAEQTKQEQAEEIAKAISERGFSDGLVWLVIERTQSVMELNPNKTIRLTDGKMTYGPDESGWRGIVACDLPEWIKGEKEIHKLMDGNILNAAPSEGGLWYRGRIHKPVMN